MTAQDDFRELVKSAPMATSSGVIVAAGSLSRAEDDEHFFLTLSSGTCVKLPISAVKRYRELGSSFGQQLVQVDLETPQLPPETIRAMSVPQSSGLLLLQEGDWQLAHAELDAIRALGHRIGTLAKTILEKLSEAPPMP